MSTNFNPTAIKAAAGELGLIMHEMSVFTDLKITVPNAGTFEVAKWLEGIVQDRNDAIWLHAEHLQVALVAMEATLTEIANNFANTDGENADKIKSSIDNLQTEINSDVSSYDSTSGKPAS